MNNQGERPPDFCARDTQFHGNAVFDKHGVAGATVWSGVMGYGAHGWIHRKGLFGVADEKPIVITSIDTEEAIRGVLSELLPMVKEGLVVVHDAEVFVPSSGDSEER